MIYGYNVILILRNYQWVSIIKQHWNFFKIDKCEDRLDASFVTATFCMAQTTCRKSCGIQLLEKKTGNHPRICTISIQNEILRSDKTRELFHTFPFSFFFIIHKKYYWYKKM